MRNVFGPRIPGGRYLCGYFQLAYTVLACVHHMDWRGDSIRVLWDDGHTTEHSTAWDAKRDRVLSQEVA